MPQIHGDRDFQRPESEVTPEKKYLTRRQFIKTTGMTVALASLGYAALPYVLDWFRPTTGFDLDETIPHWGREITSQYPAPSNDDFQVDRALTGSRYAYTHNNFYEFAGNKTSIWKAVSDFDANPWAVKVGGLVDTPRTYDFKQLVNRMSLEERVYRFRCVEAWAMVVPWIGFPLRDLIKELNPDSSANYVRFTSFMRPEQAPGQREGFFSSYPWPYVEGLRLDEAMNPLTMLVTGMYGRPLPRQNGAPIRLIVPWKYGFKNIKSITRIDFVRDRPATFWNTVAPDEYSFMANVNPDVPHPRWSQQTERLLGTGREVPTRKYNGYEEYVADLYDT